MADRVVLLSIPQLRGRDVAPGGLASLESLGARGEIEQLVPPFPGLAASAFATLMTGLEPHEHGLIGNVYYDREARRVVSGPHPDSAVRGRKLWELAREVRPGAKTMLWFGPNTRGARVDIESWAELPRQLKTTPEGLADRLIEKVGPFPEMRESILADPPFASVTEWHLRSAAEAIRAESPDLAVVRLPYLGQVARRFGPDGPEAFRAVSELERMLAPFLEQLPEGTATLAVTESIATPVTEVVYPNRVLREMGLLAFGGSGDGPTSIDPARSKAFAMADHQLCHIYLNDPSQAGPVASTFAGPRNDGIAMVIASGEQRAMLGLEHGRAGDVVLVACPDTWFAADWATSAEERAAIRDDSVTAAGATNPLIPLDADHVNGSLGAPPPSDEYLGVAIASVPGAIRHESESPMQSREIIRVVERLLAGGS